MASIEKRRSKNNEVSYRVAIRKKGIEIFKTFFTEEDAKLYSFYKERLIQNMENFEVPLEERVFLSHIFELKLKNMDQITNTRINKWFDEIIKYFGDKKYIHQISLEDWISCAKYLYQLDVFRGAKTESGKRKMSLGTLRNIFSYSSSAFSHSQSLGMKIENYPLKVIHTFINTLY